jgi:poly-beta-hydroxyalkanoate depolymerase
MHVIIVSTRNGGCGKVYGPYESVEKAEELVEQLEILWVKGFLEIDDEPSAGQILEVREQTMYDGPWIDLVELRNPESLIESES